MTAGREQDYGAAGRLGPAVPPEHNHSTTRARCSPGCPSYHATTNIVIPPSWPPRAFVSEGSTVRHVVLGVTRMHAARRAQRRYGPIPIRVMQTWDEVNKEN